MIYQKKILRYGNSLALIIPSELVHGLGWAQGDTIIFLPEKHDKVVLRHVTDVEMLKLIEEHERVIQI